MDILEKIEKLRIEKGWSQYKLALESGLTQSTLSNMYARKTLPSIGTLNNICDALNITLAQFFCEGESDLLLLPEEIALVQNYRNLSIKQRQAINELIKSFN